MTPSAGRSVGEAVGELVERCAGWARMGDEIMMRKTKKMREKPKIYCVRERERSRVEREP
jgi:hypothetical protein